MINEDKRLPKLPVIFSSEIVKKIKLIKSHNKDKERELSEWYEYIDGFQTYISNSVIAWDYTYNYTHYSNGATFIKEMGYQATYIIKTNKNTNKNYVYVFKLTLKPEEFGLDVPLSLRENTQYIKPNNEYHQIMTPQILSYDEFCKVTNRLSNNI